MEQSIDMMEDESIFEEVIVEGSSGDGNGGGNDTGGESQEQEVVSYLSSDNISVSSDLPHEFLNVFPIPMGDSNSDSKAQEQEELEEQSKDLVADENIEKEEGETLMDSQEVVEEGEVIDQHIEEVEGEEIHEVEEVEGEEMHQVEGEEMMQQGEDHENNQNYVLSEEDAQYQAIIGGSEGDSEGNYVMVNFDKAFKEHGDDNDNDNEGAEPITQEEVTVSSSNIETQGVEDNFMSTNDDMADIAAEFLTFSSNAGTIQIPSNNTSTGGGQQIVLDAQSLQGLIDGGLTFNAGSESSGSGNQQNIVLASSTSPVKRTITSPVKSPTKILPAPVPSGDQQQQQQGSILNLQQGSHLNQQRILVKQGNVLTPISNTSTSQTALSNSGAKFMQVTTGTGANQTIQYVRLQVPTKSPSPNKPIAPATSRPKTVVPRPSVGFTSSAGLSNDFGGGGNFVVLPNNYVQQIKTEQNSNSISISRPAEILSSSSSTIMSDSSIMSLSHSHSQHSSQHSSQQSSSGFDSFRSLLEPNGMRPRKPCNCTKSQCLKLYCDCFANGEFCHLCNCNGCSNNLNHEEERQKAIKLVLERNPGAFRPKIGKSSQTGEAHERRHNKGCNCRRSGCLKNYCECYEAKIFCSGICKCSGCKNCIENIPTGLPNGVGVEQHFAGAGTSHRQTLKDLAEAAEVRVQQQTQVKNKMRAQMQDISPQNNLGIMVPPLVFRQPHGTISYEVVTSTVELLIAKGESAEKQKLPEGEIERLILEEFGECLGAVMELGVGLGNSID